MENIQELLSKVSITAVLYAINFIFIFAVLFLERKTSTSRLAWIMVLAFLPVIGFIFYLVFNQNLSRTHINHLYDEEWDAVSKLLKAQMNKDHTDEGEIVNPAAVSRRDLVKLNQVYGESLYTDGNEVELITDGRKLFYRILDDIIAAKESICIEYFIIKNDEVGKRLIAALTEKAREGVKVRLLVDTQGSRGIGNRALRAYLKAGGKVGYFFPPRLYKIGIKIGLNLNYRNHRKIIVIDEKIGYTGGYNIAREYCDMNKRFGHWRDSHIRLRGEGVKELLGRFIMDWRFTTKEEVMIPTSVDESNMVGSKGVQIVNCGPEAPHQEIKRAYMKMITTSRKSVFIQSPYFVPDQSIVESLKMASQSGVDVRVMIPCKPDHVFVYWATYSFVGELLRAGCRVFIYDNGFLHAKTIVSDGEVASVGSCNFDIRSFKLNFETNAFIFDRDFAKEMEEAFYEDMKDGHELTLEDYNNRSLWIKFKENISTLMTEIL
ncbi:MAG: cardiolipin synthase [Firmicutes bacterium]|nr:cardiolipin synthase [Bacillota bacterium]